jgi:hypothetical protein
MSNPKQQADSPLGVFLGFVVGLVLLVVCWNYGATEVIQTLGGPDANVNILDGTLALLFVGGVSNLIAGRVGQ